MRKLLYAGAFLLSACASASDLRTRAPIASWNSTKPAQAVADCVRDSWQKQWIGLDANGASLQSIDARITVISTPGGTPFEVADIEATNTGSKIAIYAQEALDLGGRRSKRIDAAYKCI